MSLLLRLWETHVYLSSGNSFNESPSCSTRIPELQRVNRNLFSGIPLSNLTIRILLRYHISPHGLICLSVFIIVSSYRNRSRSRHIYLILTISAINNLFHSIQHIQVPSWLVYWYCMLVWIWLIFLTRLFMNFFHILNHCVGKITN